MVWFSSPLLLNLSHSTICRAAAGGFVESLKTFSWKTLTIYTAASALASLEKPVSIPRLGGSQAGWWDFCCNDQLASSCFSGERRPALLCPSRSLCSSMSSSLGRPRGILQPPSSRVRSWGCRSPCPALPRCAGTAVGSVSAVCLSAWPGGHWLPPRSL